ncbi:restriction endonuclease subunit S [Campylobacter upsaliensis]
MKTDTLKKSLLDYAIKGKLSAKFRRENNGLNAFNEINTYNEAIKEKRKDLEKKLKICEKELKLEKDKDKKALFKSQIQMLKKEIAKCKEITPLNFSEAPFEIPNSWAWVKLGDICEIRLGKTPPRDAKNYWNSNDYQWVSIADMGESKILTQTKEHISQAGREKCFGDFIFKKGTLLLSFKLTIGKVAFLGFDGFHNEGIASVLPLLHAENEQIFKEFLFHFLPPLTQLCESTGAIKGETLNKQKLNNLLIPLPPLKEQQEIVSKLDLLVSLANDFAITKENLKRIEKRIEKSLLKLALEGSLSKLYRRSSPTLSAFDEINTYNEAIKEKRKNLEKEFKKCEKEFKLEKDKDKKAFFKSQIQMLKKELTKCKEITPLNLSEAPFEIPSTWAWVKLGDICEINPKNDINDNVEISFIPMALIADSCQNTFTYELKLWKEVKGGFTHLRDNSVAFAKISPCFENGKSFVVKNLKNGYGAGTTELIVLLPYNPLLKEYVFYCVNSAFFVNQALKTFKGTAGQQRLNMDFVENFTIPLPPLKEQEHITQILDTLFTLKKGLRVD